MKTPHQISFFLPEPPKEVKKKSKPKDYTPGLIEDYIRERDMSFLTMPNIDEQTKQEIRQKYAI